MEKKKTNYPITLKEKNPVMYKSPPLEATEEMDNKLFLVLKKIYLNYKLTNKTILLTEDLSVT